MKVKTREAGKVTVLELKGKITIGEGDVRLREAIEELLKQGKKEILLDMGGVTFMDSSGVGEIVGCFTTVKNRGGSLKLARLTKNINDLLQITQLITIFEVFNTEAEALASFK